MKIGKKTLVEFLKKVNISNGIQEAIFDFSDSGLKISGKNSANVTRLDAVLKTSAFEEYKAIGKIGMQELSKVIMILNGFTKEVTLKVEGNLLMIEEKDKKVEVELLDIQFIEEVPDLPNLEFDETIRLKASDVNSFIKDATINKEFHIRLVTKPKVTMLTNSGKFKFTKTFETPEAKGGIVVKFASHFIEAVSSLTDMLTISCKSNYPVKIVEKTEHSQIVIVTAPVTGDEEVNVEKKEEEVKEEVKEVKSDN